MLWPMVARRSTSTRCARACEPGPGARRRRPPGPRAPRRPRSARPGPPARGALPPAARTRVVPAEGQEAARAGLAGPDREHQPGRGAVTDPRRRAGRGKHRDPRGLTALDQPGQVVGELKRGAVEGALVERAGVPPRHGGEGGLLAHGREEGERLRGTKGRREPRHHRAESPGRLGGVTKASTTARSASTARVRISARWRRLAWSMARAAVLAKSRSTGEVARGEAGAARQPVGVEHPDHAVRRPRAGPTRRS